jgi:hypothetical protein
VGSTYLALRFHLLDIRGKKSAAFFGVDANVSFSAIPPKVKLWWPWLPRRGTRTLRLPSVRPSTRSGDPSLICRRRSGLATCRRPRCRPPPLRRRCSAARKGQRPILNFAPRRKLWPQGRSCEFGPMFAPTFLWTVESVHPLGVNKGMNIPF